VRRLLPASLTGRLVVTVVALTALVAVLVGTTVTLVMRSYLTDRLDQQLAESVGRARADLLRSGTPWGDTDRRPPPGQSDGLLSLVTDGERSLATYIDTEGDLLAVPTRVQRELAVTPADGRAHDHDLPKYGSYRAVAVEQDGLTTVVALPTSDVDETVASLLGWEVLLGLGATLAAGLAGRALVRRQLRPLREVAHAAHEVTALPLSSGKVDMDVRLPERLTDPATEVGAVGDSLNRLLDHVATSLDARHASEQQLRRFLADASHELRTPLATIAGYAELSRRTPDDAHELDQALRKVESEAARMSTLVEDMLLLARLDAGRPLEREPVDLTLLVMEALDDARVVDADRTWRLDLPDEPVGTLGDEQRLHQVVTNLLVNASRHTPPGTTVTAGLRADADRAVLTVHDDGPGVAPELQRTIFERFSRGDSSRTRASGGAGLGMSLVRAIAESHGGTATVRSAPGDTTFTVSLPLHSPATA
jgi:two-component system OmpR family sensor kinase